MSKKEKVDVFLSKVLSRKLTVFLIGSIGMFIGKITSDDWVIIATVYIGAQMATDIIERLIKAKVNIFKNEERGFER